MKQQNTKKFSIWTLWSPIKFAAISFGLIASIVFIYGLITHYVYGAAPIPQAPLFTLLTIALIVAAFIQIKTLPREKMDRPSFIAIHNTQTAIMSLLFLTSSYLIVRYAQQIMFQLLIMETRISIAFLITITATLLFYLYLLGLNIANIYAKFRRAREMNIPTWKIILSMPFGFAALWAPGYILATSPTKQPTIAPKSKQLQAATEWITQRPAHTIAAFIAVTLLSGFFFGFNSVLLTFSLTLIFGIWALQRGTKNFTKNMPGKYSSAAVIFNIIMLTMFFVYFTLIPQTTQDVQATITTPEQIEIIEQ